MRRRTKVGLYTAAIGGGPDAARRSGIAIDRYVIGLFVATGVVVAVAAALTVGQLGSASPVHRDRARARRDHRRGHRRHEPRRRLRLGEPDGGRRDVHERAQQRSAQPRAHRRLLPIGARTRVDRRPVAADRHASSRRTSPRTQRRRRSKERSANEARRVRRQGRLVTGAAQGIGRQICLTLVDQGCRSSAPTSRRSIVDGVTAVEPRRVGRRCAIDTEQSRRSRATSAPSTCSCSTPACCPRRRWSRHDDRRVGAPAAGQPHRAVPALATGRAGNGEARLRSRRAHRVERRHHRRRRRAATAAGLRRVEGRRDGARSSRSPASTRRPA